MEEKRLDARHYTLANVDRFWTAGNPVVLPIAGMPRCSLDIHPAKGTITLRTPFTPPEPDLAKWRNIAFRASASSHGEVAEITVTVDNNLHAAYGLLTSVADQLQLQNEPLASAVALAVAQHRQMFAANAALSTDKEIGLFGELLVLEFLIAQYGPGQAIAAWQGPLFEEHDFVLDDIHLEVKTTSGDRRQHVMHGFTQLVPLQGVPLSLLSIQLTRSSPGGGRTLAALVSEIRAQSGGLRPDLDDRLQAVGWSDDTAELYSTSWTLRSPPCAYDIDERFPAMTFARLSQAIPNLKVVSDLSYRVDLTSFEPCPLPGPLAGLVAYDEEIS